ncbi:hypothetical protein [Noviherbaspirillum aerium]|uniref:hypothetical protein n=1 Tax=Noviherbaspirillum aerium TaxID=2588497 RepID=UPI00124DDCA1|nr:hypothetical protein [Noviherbaspirillum aerium]
MNDDTYIEHQIAMHQLFARWRASSDVFERHFVEDGIISPPEWIKAPLRVLFLLKETNDYEKSITALIRDVVTTQRKSALWRRPTFHNIGRWAHGLAYGTDGGDEDFRMASRNRRRALLSCAVINLKKTTGGRAATVAVEQAAARDAAFLREQIGLVNPEIVVCGGTFNSVRQHLFPGLVKVADLVYAGGHRLFIKAQHPAYVREREQMFRDVVGSYHRYRTLTR